MIDGLEVNDCEHNWVFLHYSIDGNLDRCLVFFCSKCLVKKSISLKKFNGE